MPEDTQVLYSGEQFDFEQFGDALIELGMRAKDDDANILSVDESSSMDAEDFSKITLTVEYAVPDDSKALQNPVRFTDD